MPLSTFVMRVEFALMGFKQRLKRPFIPRYRRARLKFLALLVAVYALPQRFLNWCWAKGNEAQKKIDKARERPFFVTDNPNKIPMPQDMRAATTRLSLQQQGFLAGQPIPRITNQEIVKAYKRAEMVRGDGKVPQPSEKKPTVQTKVMTAAELRNSIEETVKSIEEQSARVSKALVGGIIGGIASATRDLNMNPEDDDVDLDAVREDSGTDS